MLNKRLISFMKESMNYVIKNVFTQWIMLLLNIIMMAIIAFELESILLYIYYICDTHIIIALFFNSKKYYVWI